MSISLILLAFALVSEGSLQKIEKGDPVVEQGQAFQVSFREKKKNVRLNFLDQEAPCYLNESLWECFAAVPADSKTGEESLKILSGDREISNLKVKILAVLFPTETLNLSEDKKALLTHPGREQELKKIRAALATESQEKFWEGKFIRPVEGKIESSYGERRWVNGKIKSGYHRGTDIASEESTPILSFNHGTVLLAGMFIEEGNMVMVDHGQGLISAYLHLSKIRVKKGQKIKRGDAVGNVGTTGVVTSPHLHFGVYIHGTPVNPLFWINP